MRFSDAAEVVLTEAQAPLHFKDIAARALSAGLLTTNGATPDATMGARLYSITKTEGASPFVRLGGGMFDLVRRRPGGIDDEVQKINNATRERLTQHLHQMPAKTFEAMVRSLLIEMGFDEATVRVTSYSGDGGVDVYGDFLAGGLTKVSAAVQAKRWKKNVQSTTVREFRGSLRVGEQGTIITTSDFSSGARAEAEAVGKSPIGLIDGASLVDLLMKFEIGVKNRALTVCVLDEEYWADMVPPTEVKPAKPLRTLPDPEPPIVPPPVMPPKRTFELLGETYPFTTWRGMLLAVSEQLFLRYREDFGVVAPSIRGNKRTYIRNTTDGMRSPKQIVDSEYWLEQHLSGELCVSIGRQLLSAFGEDPESLVLPEETQVTTNQT